MKKSDKLYFFFLFKEPGSRDLSEEEKKLVRTFIKVWVYNTTNVTLYSNFFKPILAICNKVHDKVFNGRSSRK